MSAWTQAASNVRVFFITIAVLLGTGILGLPVTLVNSGFVPFLIVFTVTLVMQLATVLLQTDNMQIAQKLLLRQRRDAEHAGSLPQPDLHSMGRLFLPRGLSFAFDASVLVTFVSTLISYALAGASAFSDVLNAPVKAIILPFVLCCVVIIVFFSRVIQPVISLFTFVKVVLLCLIIGAVGLVSEQVAVEPSSNWATIMQPFLIGTVAIGGIADTMPVMISGADLLRRSAVIHFRWSVATGVCACYILNLLWGLFVLHIVPQTSADAVKRGWSPDLSLAYANSHGEIATIPVTKVIDTYYAQYSWVARLVTAFIILSICVSFNAVGLALKHALDGLAVSVLQAAAPYLGISTAESAALRDLLPSDPHASPSDDGLPPRSLGARVAEFFAVACDVPRAFASALASLRTLWSLRSVKLMLLGRGSLYVACFGIVLIVALANPSGFLIVLGVFTSMSLNLAGGVFVAMMFWGARSPRMRQILTDKAAADKSTSTAPSTAAAIAGDSDKPTLPLLDKYDRSTESGIAVDGTVDGTVTRGGRLGVGELAGIALPLAETGGHVAAVLVCASFVLAVAYDIDASSLAPVGASWATAFTGVAFTLVVHHVVLPSVTAVVGSPMNGPITRILNESEGSPEASNLASALSWLPLEGYGVQCEIVAVLAWLVYALRAGPSALAAAALLSIWQMGGLLMSLFLAEQRVVTMSIAVYGTLVDGLVLGGWGVVLVSLGPSGAAGGGLAIGVAVVVLAVFLLRWRLLRRPSEPASIAAGSAKEYY